MYAFYSLLLHGSYIKHLNNFIKKKNKEKKRQQNKKQARMKLFILFIFLKCIAKHIHCVKNEKKVYF